MQETNLRLILQAKKTQGYLEKKSDGLIKKWQRRYFIIIEHILCYYDDESLERVKKKIRLDEIISVDVVSVLEFCIVTTSRSYNLKAETIKNLELWVASLTLIKDWKPIPHGLSINVKNKSITKKEKKRALSKNLFISSSSKTITPESLFFQVGLTKLAEKINHPEIRNKLIIIKAESEIYFLISCKTIEYSYLDEDFLDKSLIEPYSFNIFYSFPTNKLTDEVREFCKSSEIISINYEKTHLELILENKKITMYLEKNLDEITIQNIILKIKLAIKIGQEYHNNYKIIINRNIDRILYQEEKHLLTIKEIAFHEFEKGLREEYNGKKVLSFFKKLDNLKIRFNDFINCCRVKKPEISRFILEFVEQYYEQFFELLSRNWKNLQTEINPIEIKKLIKTITMFHKIFSFYFQDARLLNGCHTLMKMLFNHYEKEIIAKIGFVNIKNKQIAESIDEKSIENEIYLSNNILRLFHIDLKMILEEFSEFIYEERTLILYVTFYWKVLNEMCLKIKKEICNFSEEEQILAVCNEIQEIREILLEQIDHILWADKKNINNFIRREYFKQLETEIKIIESLLIKKFFELSFSTINLTILNRSFEELDMGLICTCVLDKIGAFNRINKQVKKVIYEACFEEICFFYYCCLVKGSIPKKIEFTTELIIKKIKNETNIIQNKFSFYISEDKIKIHLKDLERIIYFLSCDLNELKATCKNLKREFENSFDEEAMKSLLNLRDLSSDKREKAEKECIDVLRTNILEEMSIGSMLSRESYLETSIYSRKSIISLEEDRKKYKKIAEGYLLKNLSEQENYFKILNKKLYEYEDIKQTYPKNYFSLESLKKIIYPLSKKNAFILNFESDILTLQAKNEEECLEWVSAFYEELNFDLSNIEIKEEFTVLTCCSTIKKQKCKINSEEKEKNKEHFFVNKKPDLEIKNMNNTKKINSEGTSCCVKFAF